MNDPFARFGAFMVRKRWFVLATWLIVVGVAGGVLSPRANNVVKGGGFVLSGSESAKADESLKRDFNASTVNDAVIVFRSTGQTVDDAAYRTQVTDAVARLEKVPKVRTVLSFFNTGDPTLVSKDRHTTLAIVALEGDEGQVQKIVPALRDQLKPLSIEHYVTGAPAVSDDSQVQGEEDLRRAELVTVPLILVLLLIVFRTVLASVIPLVLGACSVLVALSAIYPIGLVIDTSVFALNVASMIGLGLSVDFSLITITRYREEKATGLSTEEAVAITMATAGRSILYSGLTVLASMLVLTLLLSQIIIVRSISYGVMLVAIAAMLSGLTLLPAILGALGHRIEWLRIIPRGKANEPGHVGFFYRLSIRIMRHPWIWLGGSALLMLLIALPARHLALLGPEPQVLPGEIESVRGANVLGETFGANRLTPIQIVVRTEKNGAFKPEFLAAIQQLTDAVAADPRNQEVRSLATLTGSAGVPASQFTSLTRDSLRSDPNRARAASVFVNLNGDNDTQIITITSKYGPFDDQHQAFIRDLHKQIIPGVRQLRAYDVLVGGNGADFINLRDALYGRFPILVAVVLLMTYFILMMFFQSLFLPLKAILLNVISILATYGVLTLIFQDGVGKDLFGFHPLGKISLITPAILFVILFALSTDYEVFLLSRVKEYYHATMNNREAVATGLDHTAGVITAAGLILVGVNLSFTAAKVITIKEIGVGVATGVLLDSTIVRVIMVPATMRLLGDRNWWMPEWLRRIVPELREGPAPALALATATAAPGAAMPAADAPVPAVIDEMPEPLPTLVLQTRPAMPRAHLRPVGGSVGAVAIALPHTHPLRIGRNTRNELQLFDERISRFHARIDYADGQYLLTDLNSSNGVYLNGERIAPNPERVALHNGDVFDIGRTSNVAFTFELRPEAVTVGASD